MSNDSDVSPAVPTTVGIIAGGGRFPFLVADSLRRRGIRVVCAAIRHQAFPELADCCDQFRFFGLGRFNRVIRYFRAHGAAEISWAGWIRKEQLFKPWRLLSLLPDWRIVKLYFFKVPDRQNQTLLGAFADEFESEGITVTDSTKYCPELLCQAGVLSRKQPSKKQLEDIAFGWKICKRMADLDVGQSVVVCERSTIAVEGLEGTDRNIRRAGELYRRGGFVVVKLAKDDHDMRFDVPTVGPATLDSIHEAGGAVLALEAKKTLIVDREDFLSKANRFGLVVAAFEGPPEG